MTEPLERKELEWHNLYGDDPDYLKSGPFTLKLRGLGCEDGPILSVTASRHCESETAAKSLAQRLQNVLDGTEERPESDLISRQAAIEEMKQQFDVTYFNTWDDFIPVLENLPGWAEPPSAPLEPRVTKETMNERCAKGDHWRETTTDTGMDATFNFCPDCGTPLAVVSKEEEICYHESQSGIDPFRGLNDPDKIWLCHSCGKTGKQPLEPSPFGAAVVSEEKEQNENT